jgi:prepilin-type N-terminal cleavage/methylation domain-containing protein
MRERGLTLLEILVVIGILAILLSISNQIAQLLRDTGARAKAETTALTVNFLLNRPDGDDFTISSGATSSTLKLESDASITSVEMNGLAKTSVTFDVRGRPNNTKAVVIQAAFQDRNATVRLLTTGKTVVQ